MSEETLDATTDEEIYVPQLGVDTSEPESDSSPEREENHEEKNTNDFQSRIDKVTRQKYEEKRRADALAEELDNLKREREALNTQNQKFDVEIPKLPSDMYDEDELAKYHQSMIAYNTKIAQQAASQTFERQQQELTAKQRQDARQQVVASYQKNAQRDGVDMDKLFTAEAMLNKSGISDSLGNFIMNDPNGGKIVEYLYDNPAIAEELLSLDPVTAGVRIASEIKPRALSTTPKVSNAPDPLPEISGGGVVKKDDFDRQFPGTEFI